TFGELFCWHLEEFGSRPAISPAAKIGRPWSVKEFADRLGRSEKTVRNWKQNKNLPNSAVEICDAFFSTNLAWEDARLELSARLVEERAKKRGKVAKREMPDSSESLVPTAPSAEPAQEDGELDRSSEAEPTPIETVAPEEAVRVPPRDLPP